MQLSSESLLVQHSNGQEEDAMPSLGCGDESDYIISVMIPSKEQDETAYNQVEKIYVVVLKPNKRYITYSCELQKPILA